MDTILVVSPFVDNPGKADLVYELLGDSGRYVAVTAGQPFHLFLTNILDHANEQHVVIDSVLEDSYSACIQRYQKTPHSLLNLVQSWYEEEPIGLLLSHNKQLESFRFCFPHAEIHVVEEVRRGCVLVSLLWFHAPVIIGCTQLSPHTKDLPLRDPLRMTLESISKDCGITKPRYRVEELEFTFP